MADGKYGRLFTENDVQHIVNMARLEGAPYELSKILSDLEATGKVHFTFPADEPLFLLRGRDRVAHFGVDAYREACEFGLSDGATITSVSIAHRQEIKAALEAMLDWQEAHPDRVKVPD